MYSLYDSCSLCGRSCGVNRRGGGTGYCGETDRMRLSLASLHFGEEPPLVKEGGSGTLFFSGCSLGCSFCQNYQISREGAGREVSEEEFAMICLSLEAAGAENINIVTGTHFIPGIAAGLDMARKSGSSLPVVWNTSGCESPEALDLLIPRVDIFLTDVKTLNPETAEKFFAMPEYPLFAERSLERMVSSKALEFRKGRAGDPFALERGVILRHLVLPGLTGDTRKVLSLYGEKYRERAVLSLMTQYTPMNGGPERKISSEEYEEVLGMLDEFSIEDGFFQEPDESPSFGKEWLPDFYRRETFPSKLAVPVWHWLD